MPGKVFYSQNQIQHFLIDLGIVKSVELMQCGYSNTSYLVEFENQNKVIFTAGIIEDGRPDPLIHADFLIYLDCQGFPCPQVIKLKGNTGIKTQESVFIFVKKYIKGRHPQFKDYEILHKIGNLIAKFHNIPKYSNISNVFSYGIQQWDLLPSSSFKNWLLSKKELILNSEFYNQKRAMVHGDLFADNIIVDKFNEVNFIDFEEICFYPAIFDLGMAIAGNCVYENGNISLSSIKTIIDGYNEIKDLSQTELKCLGIATVYAMTATAFWRYREYNVINEDHELKDRYKPMKIATENMIAIDLYEFLRGKN